MKNSKKIKKTDKKIQEKKWEIGNDLTYNQILIYQLIIKLNLEINNSFTLNNILFKSHCFI